MSNKFGGDLVSQIMLIYSEVLTVVIIVQMMVIIINVGNAYSKNCLSILEALYMLSELVIAHTPMKKAIVIIPI